MAFTTHIARPMEPIARAGLISKGIVYCLLGILAFMAAFEIDGHSNDEADKKGVFGFIEGVGGKLFLGLLAAGLVCYTIWRIVQAFSVRRQGGSTAKRTGKFLRYLFSGLVYLSFAFYAFQRLMGNGDKSGKDDTQGNVSKLMDKPFGPWLVGLLGLAIAAVGIYQVWYGMSEKYKKHVQGLNLHSTASRNLLRAGKIGYVARGLVWLILSWLIIKAAVAADSREAGDLSKAFGFLEAGWFGSYLLGALGIGLVCYGAFNFIRARFESF